MALRVWVNGRPVGSLDRHGRGTTFAYDRGVDPRDAVSLTMPVRTASYDSAYGLLPVFDTNLPEGILRDTIQRFHAKAHGHSDPLDILGLTGRNQIGRIRVLQGDEQPARQASVRNMAELLEKWATRAFVNEIVERYALRSGVSGAMPKVLVETDPHADADDSGHSPRTILTSDYILKFDAEDYPGLSLNEFYSLEAARAGGNVTANAKLSADGRMLSVSRFDGTDGNRLGFEDLASLNAKTSAEKYSGSIETALFKRLAEFSGNRKKENLEALYRLCVTNIAIRNGDAHLKNFALLFDDADSGPFKFSPAYDLVTTTAWIKSDMMALTCQGTKRWPKPEAVLQLGARAGLSKPRSRNIIAEVGAGLRTVMPAMLDAFEAHGRPAIGQAVANAWNEGLTMSLGVEAGTATKLRKPSAGGDAEEDRSPPESSPFGT